MRHLLRVRYLLAAALALSLWPHEARLVRARENNVQYADATARKFDEFGEVGGCDHGARLDNFAITLMNEPTVTGYIITYGPEGKGDGTGELRRQISEDYLVNTRGIDPARFKSIYGGRYREISGSATELWIVPFGAEPPEPQDYGNAAANFNGLLTEYDTSDALYGGGEGTGPAFGNNPLAGMADILRQQPEKLAYIVSFNSSKAAPGAWRRGAREVALALERSHGIKANRIKTIYGGYKELKSEPDARDASARVQLWVAPADAPPVAGVTEPEPRPEKAVQIVSVDEYALNYEDNSRLAFEGFAEILKNDPQMRACIIIRLENKTEEIVEEMEVEEQNAYRILATAEAVAATEPAVEETPRLDLIRLVEKWKSDLEGKYGISSDRLLVIMGTSQHYQSASLETWIVPPGAALPDPSIVEEDETLPEEETSRAEQNPQ